MRNTRRKNLNVEKFPSGATGNVLEILNPSYRYAMRASTAFVFFTFLSPFSTNFKGHFCETLTMR